MTKTRADKTKILPSKIFDDQTKDDKTRSLWYLGKTPRIKSCQLLVSCLGWKPRLGCTISKSNGRDLIKINPIYWGKKVEKLGAGEIFLTSVNREGLKEGFDLQLTKDLSKSVSIPLIAHGGAGNFNHVYELIKKTNVSGVSVSSLLHYDLLGKFNFDKTSVGNTDFLKNNKKRKIKNNLKNLKKYLLQKNIKVRI